jgi:hypothetical protein
MVLFYRPGLLDGGYLLGNGTDPYLYIWAFHFIPHAIAHGTNPFIIPANWAPAGLNITQATTTPGLALLFWPLTALIGPVASFNVATLLAPPLSAIAAYALAFTLTGRALGSFVAGWIFGFSTYVVGAMLGHLQTDFVPLVPLAFLVVLQRLRDPAGFGPVAYVGTFALIDIAQFLISLETFVTTALFLGVIFLVQTVVSHRTDIRRMVGEIALFAGAYLISFVVMAPFFYYFFRNYAAIPHILQNGGYFCIDLLNLIIPTPVTWIGGHLAAPITDRFSGGIAEDLGYIGLPLAVITIVAAVRLRRDPIARLMALLTGLAVLCALGPWLHVAGHAVLPLPWIFLERLPLLGNVVTGRLMLYAALGIAILCALWLASLRSGGYRGASALVFLAALLTLPNSISGPKAGWYARIPTPRLFTGTAYRRVIPQHAIVMFMPFQGANGDAILWTTLTRGYFKSIDGYGNFIPPPFSAWPVATMLNEGSIGPDFAEQFNLFMKHFDATRVIVPQRLWTVWNQPLAAAGWQGRTIGRFAVFSMPASRWDAIPDGSVVDAQYAAARVHLDALRRAAGCLLAQRAPVIDPDAAVAAHCLDPAFASHPGPATNWDQLGGWLGRFGTRIGVAVTTDGTIARRIVQHDRDGAAQIYFPYPKLYDPKATRADEQGELIFAYDRARLMQK